MHALYLNWSILNFLEHEGVSMPHSGVCVYFHVSLKLELFSTNQFPGFIPLNNVWTYAEVPFLPQGEGELQQGSLPPPHEAVLFCLLEGGTPLIQLSIEKHAKPTLRDCNFTPHVTIFWKFCWQKSHD